MSATRSVVRVLSTALLVAGLAACSGGGSTPGRTPSAASSAADPNVLFEDDFETDPFPRWEPVTKSAWKWEKTDRGRVFSQFKNVQLEEKVRAPFNRNLAKGVEVEDFQFDVDLQTTARDYEHRSLCLFFGYRDSAHMYYVHFGQVTDENSNGIFLVDGKDRVKISSPDVPGTPWDKKWHHARIVRTVDDGRIDVYFDNLKTPVMSVVDKTFTSGGIGIGSFDDTGRFDNVSVHAAGQVTPR